MVSEDPTETSNLQSLCWCVIIQNQSHVFETEQFLEKLATNYTNFFKADRIEHFLIV